MGLSGMIKNVKLSFWKQQKTTWSSSDLVRPSKKQPLGLTLASSKRRKVP